MTEEQRTLFEKRVDRFSEAMMIPLTQATETALRPARVWSSDRLEVELDETGDYFILEVFQVTQRRINELHGGGESCRVSLTDEGNYLLIEQYSDGHWREVDKRQWSLDQIRELATLVWDEYLNGTDHIPLSQVYNSLYELHYGRRAGASRAAAIDFFKRIPEKEDISYGKSKCAATDVTALIMHRTFTADQILFKDDDTADLYFYLLRRFLVQAKTGIQRSRFMLQSKEWNLPHDWVEHPDLPLTEYQRVAAASILESGDGALFMDMGTGKTPTAIQVIQMEGLRCFRDHDRMSRQLVICPRAVRMNWEHEFFRFACVPGQVSVIRGGPLGRAKQIVEAMTPEEDSRYTVVIASYETVIASWDYFKRIPWDRVTCDESHLFRHETTARWKCLEKLRETSSKRMILTGTPIANSVMDFWAQFEFLGSGLSGFMRKKAFRSFYGRWKKLKGGVEKLVAMKNLPMIQERLTRLAFQITKAEAGLHLPDKVHDEYEVSMTKRQAEIYSQTAAALVVEIEAMEEAGMAEEMTVEHVLTKLLRLAQITSGFWKPDRKLDPEGNVLQEGDPKQISPENPKVTALLDLVRELDDNGKMIVWACFREDIRIIHEALDAEGISHGLYFGGVGDRDREKRLQEFNGDPECKVFVANPECGGTGLNLVGYNYWDPEDEHLPTNTTHMVFFSQNWKPLLRSQGEDRAHRRGTRMPLRITDLVVPGSIDEEIRARVLAKHNMALRLTNIKEIAQRILETVPEGDDS